MPDESNFENDNAPGFPVNGLTDQPSVESTEVKTQLELEAALARMADPEVRGHFEELLRALGHRN